MKPAAFKKWRKSLGLSQKDAAHVLGLKRRVVQYYEKGERDGKKVEIPLSIRLACYALSEGVADFDGEHAQRSKHPEDGVKGYPKQKDAAPAGVTETAEAGG